MSTIADVTEDRPSAVAPDAGGQQPAESAALSAARAAERRSLLVPVLSTACAALIAGVLGLAVVGFNTLRDDMNARFGEVNAVLLDHTERLARIETTLGVESRTVQQP
ncbi:hypothetical protein [Candidatus Poriferisodalis sp.]|uniref:hypothetical protein n=1 Tax=Candidatus Poriferisodalis sp. TaxID=3101277 RepID=UPI003B5984A1